jgi:hypothetical protein
MVTDVVRVERYYVSVDFKDRIPSLMIGQGRTMAGKEVGRDGRTTPSVGSGVPIVPSFAAVRDHWLGGSHNAPADRELAEQIMVCIPYLPYIVRSQRAFLRRVARYLVEKGVQQFLDLGSGLPTAGNVHEVVQEINPDGRVVYADIDPVVVSGGRAMIADSVNTAFIHADFRQPEAVLAAPGLRALLDLDEPVAVFMIDVLQHISDSDNPAAVVGSYVDAMSPGSYVALSHLSQDEALIDGLAMFRRMYDTPPPEVNLRDSQQIADLLAGLDLVAPGVVRLPLWHSAPHVDGEIDLNPDMFPGYAALGRKPRFHED